MQSGGQTKTSWAAVLSAGLATFLAGEPLDAAPVFRLPNLTGFNPVIYAQVTGPSVPGPNVDPGPSSDDETMDGIGTDPTDDFDATAAVDPVQATLEATAQTTNAIVSQVNEARTFCGALSETYRIDCLAKELGAIADGIPAQGDYAAVKRALTKASDDLSALSRQNRDLSQPALRVSTPGSEAPKSRVVTAIAPESLESSNAAAISILDEATTVLLRASSDSEDLLADYSEIADALETNKVLLRS